MVRQGGGGGGGGVRGEGKGVQGVISMMLYPGCHILLIFYVWC